MKKSSYISGIISLSIVLIATIFKASHLPGANILLLLGIGSLSFIFMPLSYFQLLNNTTDNLLKWVYHMAFISFFIDFIGMIFKILHWPGASILMLIGIPLPFILFLPMYLTYHNKRELKTDVNFSAILLFMIYLGVFSSFLAVSPAKTVIHASADSIETMTKANSTLAQVVKNSHQSILLVNKLENVKSELALQINENNKNLLDDGKLVDIDNMLGKDLRINYLIYQDSGLQDFDNEFSSFKTKILKTTTNNLVNQLFAEIDLDRVPKGDNEYPSLVNLPLINAINILTDWQNKILLIEYAVNQ